MTGEGRKEVANVMSLAPMNCGCVGRGASEGRSRNALKCVKGGL